MEWNNRLRENCERPKWKFGDKVIIGGKHAEERYYDSIVGEIAVFQRAGDYTHAVSVNEDGDWWVHAEDLLSAEDATNIQLTGLLKEEF